MADVKTAFLDDAWRQTLERESLRPFLERQRWFGGKARAIRSVRFRDWASIEGGAHPFYVTVVTVAYEDGTQDEWHVPLTVMTGTDAQGMRQFPDAVLAPVPDAPSSLICDAVWSDEAMRALMSAVESSSEFVSKSGRVVASANRDAHHPLVEPGAEVVRLPAVHSNSALALAGRYLLKLFRRVEAGINPDVEIGRFLERTGARVNTPALVGSIEYRSQDAAIATLALVQRLVPSRTNAWDEARGELEAFFRKARQQRNPPVPEVVRELVGVYADAIALLGRRTAELHRALSTAEGEPDFAPELISPLQLSELARRERQQAADILDLLDSRHDVLDEDAQSLAHGVLARRAALLERVARLWSAVDPYVKIRIHGDYHLGQVLCVGNDFVIIDFEGEPARPLAERRAKQSPLRDVAGMLRSLSYAAEAGLRAAAGGDAVLRVSLNPWARAWESSTSASFLDGYLRTAEGAVFMPSSSDQFRRALELFVLNKAIYELHYEMNNRPQWAALPLRGVMQILESGTAA